MNQRELGISGMKLFPNLQLINRLEHHADEDPLITGIDLTAALLPTACPSCTFLVFYVAFSPVFGLPYSHLDYGI